MATSLAACRFPRLSVTTRWLIADNGARWFSRWPNVGNKFNPVRAWKGVW